MCGLVGVAGVLGIKDIRVFNELLYANYVRGKDSTGVGVVRQTDQELRLIKGPYDPLYLQSIKYYDGIVNPGASVLMGHNRAATRGKVNRNNSHPFIANGRILGAHNGTLDHSCLRGLSDGTEGETDSEQLIQTIADDNGSITSTVGKCEGSWALSVYDQDDNSISLLRNNQRPLFYAFAESRNTLYWASEAYMLRWILDRNEIKSGKIFEVPIDTILSWVVPKHNQMFNEKADRTKAEGKQRVPFHSESETPWMEWGPHGGGPYQNGKRSSYDATKNSSVRPATDADEWEIWQAGWDASEVGKYVGANPYNYTPEDKPFRQMWLDGFNYFKQQEAAAVRQAKKIADAAAEAVVVEGGPKKELLALPPPVKATVNVVNLDDKRTDLFDRRVGPGNKRIDAAKFRELTKMECGWCDNPVTFQDRGHFTTHPSIGTIFVCEECVSDEKTQQDIKEYANAQ